MAKNFTFVGNDIQINRQDSDRMCKLIGTDPAKNTWCHCRADELQVGDHITLDCVPNKNGTKEIASITDI